MTRIIDSLICGVLWDNRASAWLMPKYSAKGLCRYALAELRNGAYYSSRLTSDHRCECNLIVVANLRQTPAHLWEADINITPVDPHTLHESDFRDGICPCVAERYKEAHVVELASKAKPVGNIIIKTKQTKKPKPTKIRAAEEKQELSEEDHFLSVLSDAYDPVAILDDHPVMEKKLKKQELNNCAVLIDANNKINYPTSR